MHTCSSLFQCNFSWIQVEIVWWIFTECRVWRYVSWLKCYWTSWPGIFHFMCKCDKLRSRFCKMVCWKILGRLLITYPHPLSGADEGSGQSWQLLVTAICEKGDGLTGYDCTHYKNTFKLLKISLHSLICVPKYNWKPCKFISQFFWEFCGLVLSHPCLWLQITSSNWGMQSFPVCDANLMNKVLQTPKGEFYSIWYSVLHYCWWLGSQNNNTLEFRIGV